MLQKISNQAFTGYGPIRTLYPGTAISSTDSGIGSIGRIDHATFQGAHHIPMHPHVNDEILSYFRSGKVEHLDSEGFRASVDRDRLMLMKAGKLFYHEEWIDGESEPFEGLQIFIRPGVKNLRPEVIFQDLERSESENAWHLLASPASDTPLRFSSQTWVYDIKLSPSVIVNLPDMPGNNLTALLYVYQGSINIHPDFALAKREALVVKDEQVSVQTAAGAELVLFYTDESAPIFKGGMFSGNKANF